MLAPSLACLVAVFILRLIRFRRKYKENNEKDPHPHRTDRRLF